MKANFGKIIIPVLLGLLIAGPVFAAGGKDTGAEKTAVVKVGIVGEHNEQWEYIVTMLAKEGITIQLVKFGDYIMPNQALADGEIDLNAFQHYAFLNNQIRDKGYKLSPIGDTIIAPLGLYSAKIKSLAELKSGDKIAIPNDPTNGGRSLKVLETAGLIKVDPKAGYVPEVSDITENRLNIQFIQVEAAQTAGLLPDVAAAIINGSHATDHGLVPTRDSVYLETQTAGSDNPYVNIIAARTSEKDNPVYKKIVDAYHSAEVKKIIETVFNGIYVPAW
jgi:D-methionine transport system substrate-binding protein